MAGALVQILEEIRWRYPSVRISCSWIEGNTLRVLAGMVLQMALSG